MTLIAILLCTAARGEEVDLRFKFFFLHKDGVGPVFQEKPLLRDLADDEHLRVIRQRAECEKRKGTPKFLGLDRGNHPYIMCWCGEATRPTSELAVGERCRRGSWAVVPNAGPVAFRLSRYANACAEFILPEPEMTNDDLEEILFDDKGDLKVTDVDELIPLLPASLRASPSFLYATGSTQKFRGETRQRLATPTNPRVVLKDPTGQFRLAYVGCPDDAPKLPDCNRIEWQFANRATGRLEFRELRLPGKKIDREASTALRQSLGTTPESCASCHHDGLPKPRGSLRALMEPYNAWHGFYGSLSRSGNAHIGKDSPEYKNYQSFIARVWETPEKYRRYTALAWWGDSKKKNLDYLERTGTRYDPLSEAQLPPTIVHGERRDKDPNSELHKGLLEFDKFRVMRALTESDDFEKYKWALVALAAGCMTSSADLGNYLPESKAQFEARGARLLKEMEAAFARDKALMTRDNRIEFSPGRGALIAKDNYDVIGPLGDKATPQLAYVTGLDFIGDRLGVPVAAMGIARGQSLVNRHGATLQGDPPPFLLTLGQMLAKCDGPIAAMMTDRGGVNLCRDLQKKSREILGEPPGAPAERHGSPARATHR